MCISLGPKERQIKKMSLHFYFLAFKSINCTDLVIHLVLYFYDLKCKVNYRVPAHVGNTQRYSCIVPLSP